MFSGLLRPGQGFKKFEVYQATSGRTPSGRPIPGQNEQLKGTLIGIITGASPEEIEQHKQRGHPITHTIVQRLANNQVRAEATNVLKLTEPNSTVRKFLVQGKPTDPGELGHFMVYKVEEREDLE